MDWAEDFKLNLKKGSAKKGRRNVSNSGVSTPPELDLNFDIGFESEENNHNNRTPPRKISGGWADSASKKTRGKNLIEDERFKKSLEVSPQEDEIPVIPDIDDMDEILNDVVEPPSVSVNRVVTLKELNSDLFAQKTIDLGPDVDLSILTKCLQSQLELEEPDVQWDWETMFTEITAEINTEKPSSSSSSSAITNRENMDELSYVT